MPFLEHENAHLYYEVQGEGPALLFLHGGGGNASIWYRQINFFSQFYTCIIPDARGFGRSYPLDDTIGNLDLMPKDAFAILDTLAVNRAGLVCQSMGAWTGLRMSLAQPTRFWGFVGVSSPMGVDYPPVIENAFNFVMSLAESGVGVEDAALSEEFCSNQADQFWLYRHINSFNPAVLRGDELGVPSQLVMGNLFNPEKMLPLDMLANVSVPSLFISGGQDKLVLTEHMCHIASHIPTAEFEVMQNSGHSPYFEEPEKFNQLLANWLEKQAEK